MKNFTFEYTASAALAANLGNVASFATKNGISNVWIQVFVNDETDDYFQTIADMIELCLPNAKYVLTHSGLSFAGGSIVSCPALVVCNLFEEPTSKLELKQYKFAPDDYDNTIDKMLDFINANPWVKLISLNMGASIEGIRAMNRLAQEISPEIVITGAAAATKNMITPAMLQSSDGKISTTPLVVTYIGGEDFHARGDVVVGWKGIGKEFTVTKSEGPVLYELDGQPAFDLYQKYLKIDKVPGNVVSQTIEFPLCYYNDGEMFLRCPFLLNEDGSIIMMMNDLNVGKKVKLSFGSPDVILGDIANKLNEVAIFEPQVISVNSCLGRLFFWGENIQNETKLFSKIAVSSGFLTGGEILRKGNKMLLFNETIVITAMREGDLSDDGSRIRQIERPVKNYSLNQRLATFIDTVTSDLEEYNKIVKRMAITDELTGLYNRREIEDVIENVIAENKPFALLMLDADNFKHINDTYGHREGDNVLKLLSATIRAIIAESNDEFHAGRWGGDEFMLIYVGEDKSKAVDFANELQKRFCSTTAYEKFARSVSIGIASSAEVAESESVFQIVDEKLYAAKQKGKGCIAD